MYINIYIYVDVYVYKYIYIHIYVYVYVYMTDSKGDSKSDRRGDHPLHKIIFQRLSRGLRQSAPTPTAGIFSQSTIAAKATQKMNPERTTKRQTRGPTPVWHNHRKEEKVPYNASAKYKRGMTKRGRSKHVPDGAKPLVRGHRMVGTSKLMRALHMQ